MFARNANALRRAVLTGARSVKGSKGLLVAGGAAVAGVVAWNATNVALADADIPTWVERNADMEGRLSALEVALAGKTNSAFVFIKPHACKGTPGQVEALVENSFAASGIRVTGQGDMSAETIDEKMHIDTHYGAIASKAVKLKPSELNVPDKGKADFQKMFGVSWEDALAQGLVYNAKDGAAKLGVDGSGLDAKWSTLARGKDMIKFGGGFYCGKVDGIFIMNGFYMAMRSAYTTPGEKIHWYTVSWPADSLSWADFRGSVRRAILDGYQALGLATKPDTGDNGVHASASPFEAMADASTGLGPPWSKTGLARECLQQVSLRAPSRSGARMRKCQWMARPRRERRCLCLTP